LGSAPLSNGVATFTDSSLPTGEDSITASYGGDTNFEGSSSAAVDILVENVQVLNGITYIYPIDYPGASQTDVWGINNSGTLVGFYRDATGTHGFSGSLGSLTPINVSFPTASSTEAFGINDAGTIVGRYLDGAAEHGFKDAGGIFTSIDFPVTLSFLTQNSTDAFGINNSSRIVGIYTDAIGTHGFETIVPLAVLVPATQISATASGLRLLSRATGIVSGTITIQNISRSTVNGPFQILLEQLSGDVQLLNASGTFDGFPYITVAGVNSLAPGQSATVGLQFSDPSRVAISFTPVVYSGNF
jgi:Bacterial Ig-like domain (group 3)